MMEKRDIIFREEKDWRILWNSRFGLMLMDAL